MIAVIARVPVKPEKREEAIAAVKELMTGVAGEKDTLFYTCNVDDKEPNTLVFVERYPDMDALAAHGSTPHFGEFMKKAMAFGAAPPEIQVLNEVASI